MHEATRIVILGDSVTVGCGYCGVSDDTRYVHLLESELAKAGLNIELIPSALDGVDTAYAIRRFQRMVGAFQPDHVLVMLGANDASPPGTRRRIAPVEYRENLHKIVERILALDARPLLASPIPRWNSETGDPTQHELMQPYATAVDDVAAHYLVPCANVYNRFCSHGVLESLIPDGIHPGPLGQQLIAETIFDTLVPLLRDTRSSHSHATSVLPESAQ